MSNAEPPEYICPITCVMMVEPLKDVDGHCFEKSAITQWLTEHGTCPISRRKMHVCSLRSDVEMKNRIEKWKSGVTMSVRPVSELIRKEQRNAIERRGEVAHSTSFLKGSFIIAGGLRVAKSV
jgi:hypothetical protein